MAVTPPLDEPAIPPRLQRPLAAIWISLGLHAALLALVQVAPPSSFGVGEPMIEARLVAAQDALPATEAPEPAPQETPQVAPSEAAEALPIVESDPAPATPPAAAKPPAPAASPEPAAAATMTSSVDLTYYSARDLDVQPRALQKIEPDYPADAERQKLSGTVRLQLKLEADGRVSDIDLLSATPPGVFEDAALRAFREARFAPAQKNGRPVRALFLIEVMFDWDDAQ